MDEIQPAPEPQAQPAPQVEIPAAAPAPAQDGYQKRIDELTQQLRERERQSNEAYRTIAELAARDAAQGQRQVVPQTPADPLATYRDKVAPEALEAITHMQVALEQKFARQYAQLEANFGVQQIATQASAVQGLPPQVIQHAQQLYQQARSQGLTPSHDEAINFAIGDYVRKGGKLGQVTAPVPQYGNPNAVLPGQAPAFRPATALPPNFDGLTRSQQLAHLRSRYENEPL